jgi:hypothetical protein
VCLRLSSHSEEQLVVGDVGHLFRLWWTAADEEQR